MNTKQPRLLIVRGLPGSGKSTFARNVASKFGVLHFENDEYLMINGKYVWTGPRAKMAAQKCFNDTLEALRQGNNVIVSNVFVTVAAVNKYVNAAKNIGAQVAVIRFNRDFGNVHDVPQATLNSMRANFQDYPGETIK